MRTLLIVALATLLVGAAGTPAADSARHFQLDHSNPEADSAVESLAAVVLWFTQVPQDGATTVRLIDPAGELVPVADLVQDPEDRTVFVLPLRAELAEGSYTVAWRSMAADGHVISEEFGFSVAPAAR